MQGDREREARRRPQPAILATTPMEPRSTMAAATAIRNMGSRNGRKSFGTKHPLKPAIRAVNLALIGMRSALLLLILIAQTETGRAMTAIWRVPAASWLNLASGTV